MKMDPKSPIRIIMPNGSLMMTDVTRLVIGKIQDSNKEFPQTYFRSVRIETEEGVIDLLMESRSEKALRMEPQGGIIATLKKQVSG